MNEFFKLIFIISLFLIIKCELSDGIKYKKHKLNGNEGSEQYIGSQVLRIVPQNTEQLDYLRQLQSSPNVNFWLQPTAVNQFVDIMVEPSYKNLLNKELINRNIRRRILIPDVEKKVKETIHNGIRRRSLSGNFFDAFQRLDAIYKMMGEIAQLNPDLASVGTIGTSYEKRDIKRITIGVNPNSGTKPIIYMDGGTHAREWAAVSTACYIIENLIKDYKSGDNEVKALLDKFNFEIVPVVNPDGYEYTHTKDRMWRKNRSPNPKSKCIGTDLNRNYDFHWGGKGSSHDACEEIYGGSKAFSEPESRAVSKFILDNKNRIKAYITLHAYGQYFLYPWGWTKANSPEVNELRRVALISSKALNSVYKTKYTVGSASQVLYVSQGSDDWAHGVAKIPYVYCLEMRDTGKYGFLLPVSEIIPTGKETYIGVKAMVKAISSVRRRRKSKARNQKLSHKRRSKANN